MLYALMILGFSVAIIGGTVPGFYRAFKGRELLDPVWTWRTVVHFVWLTAIVVLGMILGCVSFGQLQKERNKEKHETHKDVRSQ